MKRKLKVLWLLSLILVVLLSACSPVNSNIPPQVSVSPQSSTATPAPTIAPITPSEPAPSEPISPESNTPVQEPSVTPEPTQEASVPATISGTLTVHYIDVGQADSIFIELPSGQSMLIDAGNNADGNDVVKYIKGLGFNKIDYVIGTHPHEDHIGGMDVVIDSFAIGNIYMPKVSNNTQTFEDVLLSIQNKGLTVNTAKSGVSIIDEPGLKVSMIAPNRSGYEDLNDYSAVVKLVYKDASFLFMGDAEQVSESEIASDIDVDILKVGHHGSSSSTSTSFLNKTTPIYAVITVGEGNTYGHPTQETLNKLKNADITVYRTDLNGTIIISTDGNGYDIRTQRAETATPAFPPNTSQNPTPTSSQNPKPEESQSPSATQPVTITVYITKTGEKYHVDGCRYLKSSKIAISLTDAKGKGYGPCSVCNPPA